MLNLLIAILISLGCNPDVASITSEADLQATYGERYDKAKEMVDSGTYLLQDSGGIVIVETGGD